jgi:hypothetical protein
MALTADQFRTKIREITNTTTNDYPDASLIRDLNSEASIVQIGILRDRGVLEFDDTNYSDTPLGTFTVSASGVCKIVEDEDGNKVLTIHKVAYLVGDKYIDVPRIMPAEGNQDALTDNTTTTNSPTGYYEVGNSIVFTPTVSGGTAKIWFDREMSFLTTSDTTKVLGVPSAYHNLIAYRTALNYDNMPDDRYAKALRKVQMEEDKLEQYEMNRRDDEQTLMQPEVISGM